MPKPGGVQMKSKVACLFAIAVAGICLATAQNSSSRPASAKPGQDPLQNALKPLTPKSAMPSDRKSARAVASPSAGPQKANAELDRLEKQKIKAGSSESGGKVSPAKGTAAPKAAPSGSATNFKYQQPAGGVKATTPDANARNSSTPRVTKKN
jgi:hypothetical protein